MKKHIIKLEKLIRSKMLGIKLGSYTISESDIGKKLNLMKKLDEPLYEKLAKKYIELLKEIENK